MGEVMEPTRPWELVAMDICGPFPITANNNHYLLTFIDHLTKYTEAVPQTSENLREQMSRNVDQRRRRYAKKRFHQARLKFAVHWLKTLTLNGERQAEA